MPQFPPEKNDRRGEVINPAAAEVIPHSALINDTDVVHLSVPLIANDTENDCSPNDLLSLLSPPQTTDEIGRLGGYRLLKQLGQGGMGVVFEAEEISLKRRVALKVMKPEVAVRKRQRDRFIREAQTAAAVEHDHICPIYQVGEENDVQFIAMPLLKGESLEACLKRQRVLPIVEAMRIGREAAEGLAAAHDAGLVHRDIKPGNIWLEADRAAVTRRSGAVPTVGRVKILDFGLAHAPSDGAHLTLAGAILGTPAYMAPEQSRGKLVDHRADLFSLGVLLYEMTTGKRPFVGVDTMSIFASLATDEPTAPILVNAAIPSELSDLIMQLLSKSPDGRPANSRVVAEALLAIMTRTSWPHIEAMPSADTQPMAVNDTFIDSWRDLDGSLTAAPTTDATVAPADRARRFAISKWGSRKTWIALVIGLLVVIGTGILAGNLFFSTKKGTLVVQVDNDAESRFKNGELRIFDSEGEVKYTLIPGERTMAISPGQYSVQVVGANGVKLETTEFTMSKNSGVTLRVSSEPVVVKKKQLPSKDMLKDADRRAAEWVFFIGGMVRVNEQDNDVTAVADLPRQSFQLRSILLANRQVSDADLAHFKDCRFLTNLQLVGTQVGDEGLAHFRNCKNLMNLHLDYTRVKDAGLAHFKDCKNLAVLGLVATNVSDLGLVNFKDCKNLTNLYLDRTSVSDAGLAFFKDCKNLRVLGLDNTYISDAGLDNFKDCKNLTRVHLAGTQVSDAGMALFKDCKLLNYLNVQKTKVTHGEMVGLLKILPRCKIEHDGGMIMPKK